MTRGAERGGNRPANVTLRPAAMAGALAALLLVASGSAAPATAARDEQIPLTLDDGRVVQATVRRPPGAKGPLPAVMLFGGFQRAAQVLDRVHTDRPLIWATFDYPFEPPRKFRFPRSLGDAPEMRAAIHGSFDGVSKLYEALRQRPDVDPRRISVVGASAGAPFATVGAANSGIPGVILVQGFANPTRVLQNVLARKYRKKYGEWVEWPALWLARWIMWYCEVPDIAAYARKLRADQDVLMITAAEDDFIPHEASEALWSALKESPSRHERIDLPGAHLGIGDDTKLIADILQRATRWMEERGLL
jgi:dienelactone hydrolase